MRPEVPDWRRTYDLADTNLKLRIKPDNGKIGLTNKVRSPPASACLNSDGVW